MLIIFILLAVIGVALIVYGICRGGDSAAKPPRDEGHGVDVVWRVGRRR